MLHSALHLISVIFILHDKVLAYLDLWRDESENYSL